MDRVPRPLRAPEGVHRDLRPGVLHPLHPRARLLNRNDLEGIRTAFWRYSFTESDWKESSAAAASGVSLSSAGPAVLLGACAQPAETLVEGDEAEVQNVDAVPEVLES